VNVLFLLLTSVSASQAPVIPAAPAAAAPVVSTPIPGGCGAGGCGAGGWGATCDSCGTECCAKPSFCERLKARFHKPKACCETACEAPCAPACAAPVVAAPSCGTCGSTCDACNDGCGKKHSFFGRFKGRKHKGDCCAPACDSCNTGCGSTGYGSTGSTGCAGCAPAPGVINPAPIGPVEPGKSIEPIKKMPKDDGKGAMMAPVAPVTPAGAKIETEGKNPFEFARRYEMRVNHAADYSRLTGQLSYVHADGGLWVLRYSPLSDEDRNGGSVVLARDHMMNSYREGDLVSVEGQVISQKGSARLGGPLYRVQTISLVDRPMK